MEADLHPADHQRRWKTTASDWDTFKTAGVRHHPADRDHDGRV